MDKRFSLLPIAVVILLIGLVLMLVLMSPWILLWFGYAISPNPPTPEIEYGEFPFVLEYEKNSETITIEDTLICQFDGFEVNEAVGKYRSWSARLAGGQEYVVLLELIGENELYLNLENETLLDDLITTIYFELGSAAYYMGEIDSRKPSFPDAHYIIIKGSDVKQYGLIGETDLAEKYGIILTSWEYTAPITNQYHN